MARVKLTTMLIESLKPPPAPRAIDLYDSGQPGLVLRVGYAGAKTWRVLWYLPGGASRFTRIGRYPLMSLAEARQAARDFLRNPQEAVAKRPSETFGGVVEQFIRLHIEAEGLRTARTMTQRIRSHLLPRFRDMQFVDVRRSDIARLLDDIQRDHGAAMADAMLAIVRKLCNWYDTRNEGYVNPIVKGMRRSKPNRRARYLDDAEIVTLFAVTNEMDTFGAISRFLLLTGQRREKANSLRWDDIWDGVWHIRTEPREKGNPGKLRLSKMALAIVQAQPVKFKNPFVFSAVRGRGAFNAWGQNAKLLESKMKEQLPHIEPFTTHDLRRTFRTALDRLGLPWEVKEAAIGHAIGNSVSQTYARHDFHREIGNALDTFADHVGNLIDPKPSNVVTLTPKRGRKRSAAAHAVTR